VGADEGLERHWRLPGHFLDDRVGALPRCGAGSARIAAMSRAWSSAAMGAWRPLPNGVLMTLRSAMEPVMVGEKIFRKEGGPQMGHGNTRPIEHTLADPVVTRRMAFRLPPICDMLTIAPTPASCAAWAKKALASIRPGRIG
jgi:hypothetical protein